MWKDATHLAFLSCTPMPDYFIFGGCLRSELRFPELTETRGRVPDWTLRLGSLSKMGEGDVLSDVELSPSCRVRLSRGDGSLRYSHSCAGSFEIFAAGTRILFEPAPGGDLGIARTDFITRVLLYCVDRARVTWLHGSAVRIGTKAVAFLGQSGAGKSTLALALARSGCEHICDDTLPVEAGVQSVVWPSDHIIRLRSDTRGRLASCAHATRRESDGKFILTGGAFNPGELTLASNAPGAGRTALSALYLLTPPIGSGSRDSVVRRNVGPTSAVHRLMQHLKLDPTVGPDDPARLVRQLGTIVSSTPVFELTVSRDWARIEEVVGRLMAWHADGSISVAANPLPQAVSA
jgi:energy-coupling factor transporter ATP-binding protein EcfA2